MPGHSRCRQSQRHNCSGASRSLQIDHRVVVKLQTIAGYARVQAGEYAVAQTLVTRLIRGTTPVYDVAVDFYAVVGRTSPAVAAVQIALPSMVRMVL